MSTDNQQEKPAARERTPFYTFARCVVSILAATIFPVRCHHRENFSLDAPYILIANHQSMMDPLIIGMLCKKYEIRFVGKKELSQSKIGAWVMDHLHMISVERHNTDMAAMRQCMKVLREGKVLGIFPEGTRHHEDLMSQVETGTAVLALRAKTPLLPVYIDRRFSFLRRTNVYIGKPMDISDLCAQGFDAEIAQRLSDRIRDTFLAMRDSARNEKKG